VRISLILFLTSFSCFAAGGGGHLSDIAWPAFNFFLFFGFLFWKIRKPIKDGFNKNAELVKELYEYAEAKSKDAEAKILKYEEKMNNLEGQVQKIKMEMDEEFSVFKKNIEEETVKNISRAEKDAERRIVSEKNKMFRDLEESLLNTVISKTKEKIGGDKNLKDKATNKIFTAI
jgi:F-type H+-transporting ATPase subunit b